MRYKNMKINNNNMKIGDKVYFYDEDKKKKFGVIDTIYVDIDGNGSFRSRKEIAWNNVDEISADIKTQDGEIHSVQGEDIRSFLQ